MSSFDKSMPIINPRRYLKLVDHAAVVLTDTEVKESVKRERKDTNFDELPETRHTGSVSTSSDFSLLGSQPLNRGRIAIFLREFFSKIRNIERTQLMQTMDDGVHSTFGIFIQTKTAQKLAEYLALTADEKVFANKIIAMWKDAEDEMRARCIDEIGQPKTQKAMDAIHALRDAMEDAERLTSMDINQFIFEREIRARIHDALINVSQKYCAVLDLTSALEIEMVLFIDNVQLLVDQEGLAIDVGTVTGFPRKTVKPFNRDVKTMTLYLDIQSRAAIRKWFRWLYMTHPNLL